MSLNRFLLMLAGLVLLVGVVRLVSVQSESRSPDQKQLMERSK